MIVAYANHLAESGHSVVIRTNHIDTVFKSSQRIRFEPFRFPGKLGTIISLFLRLVDADIVVADIIPLACLLSVRNSGRVLYFAQDYNENFYKTVFQKLFIRLIYAISFKVLKIPTIAVSEELAKIFHGRFGFTPDVIHNGVDLKRFYPDADEDLLRLKGGNRAILFFSRRDTRKGFDLALATVEKLVAAAVVPIEVWTVGEILHDDEVSCSHRDFGYVPEEKLRRIMSSADLFLYPSRNEGFPLMVMEAFACRCPVVTSEAIPYAVDGENALVAPIEDIDGFTAKAIQLLTDSVLADDLAGRAAGFVQNYSLEASALHFMHHLQDKVDALLNKC